MRYRKHGFSLVLFAFALIPLYAGGPLSLQSPGSPYLWPGGGANIPFNPDLGALGPLSNAQAVTQTANAFQAWGDVSTASATYINAGSLSLDVNETNFIPFIFPLAPDGLSAIVYDEDGAIFDLLFGVGSGVLGFASPEWSNSVTGDIIEGLEHSSMVVLSLMAP